MVQDRHDSDRRQATITVAASNSVSTRNADYVCSGADDQVEIQAAIDAAAGGRVKLEEGLFVLSAQIQPLASVELVGCGPATIIQCSGDHKAYYASALAGLVIRNLTIDTNAVTRIGVHFDTCSDIIADSLWFINPELTGYPSPLCLYFLSSYNFSASNIHLTGGGLTVGSSYDGVVSDSYITGANCAHFIALDSSHGIDFVNCWNHSTYHAGIYIDEGSWDCHIIGGNYAGTAAQGAIEVRGSRNIVAFADVSESAGDGIQIFTIDGCGDVEDNLVIGCDCHGLASGIKLWQDTGPGKVRRNKVIHCNLRDCTDGIEEIGLVADVYDNTFKGNDLRGCATAITLLGELSELNSYARHQDVFLNMIAADATRVRSNEPLNAAIPLTFTITSQPSDPRTLSGHFDAHANITAYTIVITGVNGKGSVIVETMTEADGWDWETDNAFALVTSIIMTERTGTGAGDTMDIGITAVLGLSNIISATGDVYKIKKNQADAVVAGAQVGITYDTYDMAVIGIGGNDEFTIWYRSNLNRIV